MSRIEWTGQLRQREPRERDKAYLGWISKLPCLACLRQGRLTYGVHVAHIRVGYPGIQGWRDIGRSEKPHDWRTAPLCPAHHMDGPDAQHRTNERAWYERLGVWPPALCEALRRAYLSEDDGVDVIGRAARGEFAR